MARNNSWYTHGGGASMGYDNGNTISRRIKTKYPMLRKMTYPGLDAIGAWAERDAERPAGKNAKATVWFDGPVLYSYETAVACFYDTPDGAVVLVDDHKYSLTTTKQLRQAVYLARKLAGAAPVYVSEVLSVEGSVASARAEFAREAQHVGSAQFSARSKAAAAMLSAASTVSELIALNLCPESQSLETSQDYQRALGVMAEVRERERRREERAEVKKMLARQSEEFRLAHAALSKHGHRVLESV